ALHERPWSIGRGGGWPRGCFFAFFAGGGVSPLLDARAVAANLFPGRPDALAKLRRMAERGESPELLFVTRGEWRVRKSDHEAWEQGRWTCAMQARQELEWARVRGALLRGEA